MNMKKYEIWFGKDPEEFEEKCWPDSAEKTQEFKNHYVHDTFTTNYADEFVKKYFEIRDNPPAMWYWVFINGEQIMSGAIDPDDMYYIFESVGKEKGLI